jgi:hypothetical protein
MVKALHIHYQERLLGKKIITVECDNHMDRLIIFRKKAEFFMLFVVGGTYTDHSEIIGLNTSSNVGLDPKWHYSLTNFPLTI